MSVEELLRVAGQRFDFHLRVLGEVRTVTVEAPSGQVTGADLVPIAQKVADMAMEMAVKGVEAEGKKITCRMGCAACCRQMVRISTAEAFALAGVVERMPAARRDAVKKRFAEAVEGYRRAGIFAEKVEGKKPRLGVRTSEMTEAEWMGFVKKYYEVGIACPFLENESCSIYGDRPLVCREYNVTSAVEKCEQLEIGGIETVEMPVEMSERLMDVVETVDNGGPRKIAMVLALEWAEASKGEQGTGNGVSLVSLLQLMCG